MSWTEEKVALLRDCWGQGLSASQIADRLGEVTRNAVIGKAHRLGLDARPSPIRVLAPGEQPRPRAPRRAAARNGIPRLPSHKLNGHAPREGRERVRNGQHTARHEQVRQAAQLYVAAENGPPCKWPNGDPRDSGFHFCGKPSAVGRPYCPDHCAAAYIRKEPRTSAAA